MLDQKIYHHLHEGVVIPAHPLALTENRKMDEKRQRALTRYYMKAVSYTHLTLPTIYSV